MISRARGEGRYDEVELIQSLLAEKTHNKQER